MTPNGYLSIDLCMALIQPPYQDLCQRILDKYRKLMEIKPGSGHNHQAWPGGYIDHITEILNIAHLLYGVMSEMRPLPFTLSDALVALFFHDIEKPFKDDAFFLGEVAKLHATDARPKDLLKLVVLKHVLNGQKLPEVLSNAIFYAEGEINDYSPYERKMGPLAAFVHMCDIASARLWFDRPWESNETWGNRQRSGRGKCPICHSAVLDGEETFNNQPAHAGCVEKASSSGSLPREEIKTDREPEVFPLIPGMYKVP